MAYGLNMSPGYNSPQKYQTFSENNLNNVEEMAGKQVGLGNQFQGMGTGLMSKWNPRVDTMYNESAGIAARAPSWYGDRAAVTSNQAFDESKDVQNRVLGRMGINPNSGRFVGLQTEWGLARAAAEAGAKTKASQDAEATQFARQQALINQGQQGLGMGAELLGHAGKSYGAAGGAYGGLAGAYDTLATDAAKNESTKQEQQANSAQRRINDMMAEMQKAMTPKAMTPTPYGQIKPDGTINYAPGTSAHYLPGAKGW